MSNLAVRYRPRRFSEVVGQERQVLVIRKMLEKGWRPPAIMITGPFGTGKTTSARLVARALLCDAPQGDHEPCGECNDCRAMDRDNHPNYVEVDAASQGLVENVRSMKDYASYRSGSKITIVTYDESHMLSAAAQNALLQILEQGAKDVLFIFATTDEQKMLPTIKSRCVILEMKLLSAGQITKRVLEVAKGEEVQIEDKAAKIIGTYVRGHVRDALVLFEQLSKMADHVDEEMVRTYLRLDRYDEVYQLLVETDRKKGFELLENLLCNYAASDLAELIGQILLNAYKVNLGVGDFTQVDGAWLKKVYSTRGDKVLDEAEQILGLETDFATVNYATAAFANVLLEGKTTSSSGSTRGLAPGAARAAVPTMPNLRKPGKELTA